MGGSVPARNRPQHPYLYSFIDNTVHLLGNSAVSQFALLFAGAERRVILFVGLQQVFAAVDVDDGAGEEAL